MAINADQWHKKAEGISQHLRQNKYLYGSASITKIMSKGTGGLEGAAYVGRVFKNLGDVLHVKFARLLYRFSEGEWVNNKAIRKDLKNKIDELTALIKGPKLQHLSEEDKALVSQGVNEMQAVCSLLKKRGIKDIDLISKKLDRAIPSKVKIPEGLEEQIASQKTIGKGGNTRGGQKLPRQFEEGPLRQKAGSSIEKPELVVAHKYDREIVKTIHEIPSLELISPTKAISRNDISLCSQGISETIIEQLMEYINDNVKTNSNKIKILLYRPSGRVQPSIVVAALRKSGPQTALIILNHINSNDVQPCSNEIRAECKAFCSLTFWFDKFHRPATINSELRTFLAAFK